MAKVISRDILGQHTISKYNFKVIASGSSTNEENTQTREEKSVQFTKDNNPKARASDVDSTALSTNSKESLIESLMKKTDEMSSNFIKLQMKLESKEEEYKLELQRVKEESLREGIETGKAQAIKEGNNGISDAIAQFSQSVKKLEDSASEFENSLESIKNHLIVAALDIAKEVINIEVGENSNNIAKVLSSELIKELQSASKIKLKVNPKDHGVISEQVGSLSHVEVVSDSAINPGGVIAISDAGNIDSEINERFNRVKKAALSE